MSHSLIQVSDSTVQPLIEKEGGREGEDKGERNRRREGCLPPSPACQSVTEGENDRPQWGPSAPG